MFGKKGAKRPVVVTTSKELEQAVKAGEPCIEVRGELGKKLKWMQKLKPAALAALLPLLSASAVSMPMLTSAALPASMAAAGITAMDISLCMLSVSVLLAILKNYNVEVGSGKNYLRLEKK